MNKANETMDSLVKHQNMTMAPSPIKNQCFKDVFANICQAERTKKLKLDLEWKKLKEEMQTITEYKSSGKNENEEMFKMPQKMKHSEQDAEQAGCCWNGDCLFVGMSGPPMDECGSSVCASRKNSTMHARLIG